MPEHLPPAETTPAETTSQEPAASRPREAGRVISKKNRARIEAALAALQAILAEVGDEAEEAAREAARQELREARSCGLWVEAALYRNVTATIAYMFEDGRVTSAERAALTRAAEAACDTFRAAALAEAPEVYARSPWESPEDAMLEMDESAEVPIATRPVALREGLIREDGAFEACLITPGWGSSGYYPAAVLRRDGPRIFGAGLHMYLDHPTLTEEAERPERSVRDLGAVLEGPAVWRDDGWNGPGLYAPARAVETQRAFLDAVAQDIGLSIIAVGRGRTGEAEGRAGTIIDALTEARSVDFVTIAGRGGAIGPLREAARRYADQQAQQETHTMSEETTPQQQSGDVQRIADRQALQQLQETVARLERERQADRRRLVEAEGRNLIREALDAVELPAPVRARLATEVQPVLSEDGALDRERTLAAVEAGIDRETAYLSQMGRIVEGMGARPAALTQDAAEERLARAFGRLGLSESAAKVAAAGR